MTPDYIGLTPSGKPRKPRKPSSPPTLMHVQWDDDVFPRDGQLALFDILGARDKRLLAYPGPHSSTPLRAERDWTEFVITCLSERGQRLSLSRRAQP